MQQWATRRQAGNASRYSKIRQAVSKGHIEWREHTLLLLRERQISQKDTLPVLLAGEVIRDYDDDRPFPSLLVLGWIKEQPLHVAAPYSGVEDNVFIITVYKPYLSHFYPDFKTKRQ